MTQVLQVNDIGEQIREPLTLARRRRSVSAIVKQVERPKGRPFIVVVNKAKDVREKNLTALQANDNNTIMRKDWATRTVGADDVVCLIYLPLGGMMGGGKKGGGKNIGMILGMLLLAVVAPMISGAIGGALGSGFLGKLITTGLMAGLQYFLGKQSKPKANKDEDRPVYGVSGGGNAPRPGDRIPVHYGRTWVNPDLSQPDYFFYQGMSENDNEGDTDQILMKRVTVGLGYYQVHTIRVGNAVVWRNGAVVKPFLKAEVDIIEPGTKSSLVASAVYSSDQVGGSQLPRPDVQSSTQWQGPFPVVPVGETTKRIQLDYSFPQGLYAISAKNGKKLSHTATVRFEYCDLNEQHQPTGNWTTLYQFAHNAKQTRVMRFTKYVTVPDGAYAVRASHLNAKYEGDAHTEYDQITWDGLRGWLDKHPSRPGITEIAMRVPSGPATGNVPFSDVWVEVTRKLPMWNGSGWTAPIATSKAIWAAADILRNTHYGNSTPDSQIDLARFLHYATNLTSNDTCSGTIRGPVSVREALSTVLGTMRAEPSFQAGLWTVIRDEARSMRRHVISRRQMVKDSSGAEYDLDMGDGSSDVIVEYFIGGDPKKRFEHRETIGAMTNTPRRINLFGVTSLPHAVHLAKWYAAVAYWRRESRLFTMEHAGRLLQRNDTARIDTWFLDKTLAVGVAAASSYTITVDADIDAYPDTPHVMFRNAHGVEWGPVLITPTGPRTFICNSVDVGIIEGFTGQAFNTLFGKPNRLLPMTALIGTVQTLAKDYIIRSTRYLDNGNVEVMAVRDAPQVWQILGEPDQPEPPITTPFYPDQGPVIPYMTATVLQKGLALVIDWTVAHTRGAVGYLVELRYADAEGGASWETVSQGPQNDGTYTIDYREGVTEARLRARAWSANGIWSEPVFTTATLFKPVINSTMADLFLEVEMLQGQVKRDIEAINELGEESLRGALKKLDERVGEIANLAATVAGSEYEARQIVKIAVGDAYAAIARETKARVDADTAWVNYVETQVASWAGGAIEAAISLERETRVTKDEALAFEIESLRSTFGGDVTAAITLEREARTTQYNALASDIENVTTTLNGNTLTLTEYKSSVDGMKGQWGIAVRDNYGPLGGLILSGARKLDGSPNVYLGVDGDIIVTGTVKSKALIATESVITANAQIGHLIVDSHNINTGAVTQVGYASSGSVAVAELSMWLTAGSRVVVMGSIFWPPSTSAPVLTTEDLTWGVEVTLDGGILHAVRPNIYYTAGGELRGQQTTVIHRHIAQYTGSHFFGCKGPNPYRRARLIVMEYKK